MFACLLTICSSCFEKCQLMSFTHFLTGSFWLLMIFLSSLQNQWINLLTSVKSENTFSQSFGCLFILLMVSFAGQKFLCLMQAHMSIFALNACASGVFLISHCLHLCPAVFQMFIRDRYLLHKTHYKLYWKWCFILAEPKNEFLFWSISLFSIRRNSKNQFPLDFLFKQNLWTKNKSFRFNNC